MYSVLVCCPFMQNINKCWEVVGLERIHIVRVHVLFKSWIIALENILVIYSISMFLVEILCSTRRKALHLYCEPRWISISLLVFESSPLCIPTSCEHLKVLNIVMTAVFIHSGVHSFIQNINQIILRWLYPKILSKNTLSVQRFNHVHYFLGYSSVFTSGNPFIQ